MLKNIKKTMFLVHEQIGNIHRETEAIKKNQVQTLEWKRIISEKKILDECNSKLRKTRERSVNLKMDQ